MISIITIQEIENCENFDVIKLNKKRIIVESGKYQIGHCAIHLLNGYELPLNYPLENLPNIYSAFMVTIVKNFELDQIFSEGILLPMTDIKYFSKKSNRKLLSVQKVEKVTKHLYADRLENCEILGWNVVIKIDEAKVGEKVVYCEIDSLLPADSEWLPQAVQFKIKQGKVAKLNEKNYFRVKSVNIMRSLSQGLLIPLKNFGLDDSIEIGTDLSKFFGVKRYSRDEDKNILGDNFPTDYVKKTNEKRIQCEPDILNQMKKLPYYATVKLDGTSATFLYTDKLLVCSRQKIVHNKSSFWWQIAQNYNLEKLYSENIINKKYCIQGEICGPKIQRNLLSLKKLDFFVFTVYDRELKQRLGMHELINFCREHEFNMVPLEEICESFEYNNVKELLERAKGFYENTKHPREGLVFRNIESTISFKVINNEYLLKYE